MTTQKDIEYYYILRKPVFTLHNYHRNHKLRKLQLSHSSKISFNNFNLLVLLCEIFSIKTNYPTQVNSLKKQEKYYESLTRKMLHYVC